MTQKRHVMHGRDHAPGGADPIPCCVSTGTGAATYVERILAHDSLLAYWPLSDADVPCLDVSGNDKHFTHEGFPTISDNSYLQPGPLPDSEYPYSVGLAGEHDDGADGLTRVPDDGDYWDLAHDDPFTFETYLFRGWADDIGGFPNFPILRLGVSVSTGIQIIVLGGLYGASRHKVICKGVYATADLNFEEWIHVACTFDGTTARIYYNGAEVGSGPGNSEASTTSSVALGYNGLTAVGWIGRFAHAAIYNDALTEAEIIEHVTAATASPTAPAGDVLTSDGEGGFSFQPPTVPDGSVTTAKIVDEAVTPAKLEPGTDGQMLQTVAGAVAWVAAPAGGGASPTDTTSWLPLTTVVGGVPELVWGDDDNLIPTYTPF